MLRSPRRRLEGSNLHVLENKPDPTVEVLRGASACSEIGGDRARAGFACHSLLLFQLCSHELSVIFLLLCNFPANLVASNNPHLLSHSF